MPHSHLVINPSLQYQIFQSAFQTAGEIRVTSRVTLVRVTLAGAAIRTLSHQGNEECAPFIDAPGGLRNSIGLRMLRPPFRKGEKIV
jgi:hypothetical protein